MDQQAVTLFSLRAPPHFRNKVFFNRRFLPDEIIFLQTLLLSHMVFSPCHRATTHFSSLLRIIQHCLGSYNDDVGIFLGIIIHFGRSP